MKKDTHIASSFVTFVCASCGSEYEIKSTINQQKYTVDICGSCHPFYSGATSGQQVKGRAEKFSKKLSSEKATQTTKTKETKKSTNKKIVKSLNNL